MAKSVTEDDGNNTEDTERPVPLPETEFEMFDWRFIPLLPDDLETLKHVP